MTKLYTNKCSAEICFGIRDAYAKWEPGGASATSLNYERSRTNCWLSHGSTKREKEEELFPINEFY